MSSSQHMDRLLLIVACLNNTPISVVVEQLERQEVQELLTNVCSTQYTPLQDQHPLHTSLHFFVILT